MGEPVNPFDGMTPGAYDLWRQTGNDHTPDWPLRFPSAGARPGAVNVFPGAEVPADKTQRVIQADNYQSWQTDTRVLLAGAQGLEILGEPPNTRAYLEIRVAVTSVGSLAVGLNNIPASGDQANWLIGPGQVKVYEVKVPQNRLFGLAVGGNLRYVITYANLTVI